MRLPRDWSRLAIGSIVMLLATVVLIATPTAAQAAPAQPGSLSPNGTDESAVPTLAWSAASGAARYEVQASASSTFDSVVLNTSTENTRYVPMIQLPAANVYWRVRSVSSGGVFSAWTTASFGQGQAAGPTLLSPADAAVLPQPDEPAVLAWSPVTGASSYEISVDNDTDFVGAKTYTTSTTSYLVADQEPATAYWWKVRALRGSGLGTDWSRVRSYTVGGLPEVVPSLPVEQQKVEDIVFDWPAVPGATDYELRVSEDRDFNTLVPGTPMAVRGTRYSPPATYDNDEYYWQVRARDVAGKAIAWSDDRVPVRHFQRHWDGAPELTFPADSVAVPVGDPFFLEWTPVDHASRYEIQMGSNSNFSPNTFVSCFTRATTYTPGSHGPQSTLSCTPDPGKVYYWRVRGLDDPGNVQGLWSTTRAFVYDPGVVTQVAPADEETVDFPTLSWNASTDAEKYLVQVFSKSGSVVAATETYSLTWTPPQKLDPTQGPFRWTVVSIDANGHRSASLMIEDQPTFTLTGNTPLTTAAKLAPLGGTPVTARFPTLRWAPDADAAYYKVYVGVAGTPTLTQVNGTFAYPEMSDVSKTFLGTGSYDWLVEAYGPDNRYLGRGTRGTFRISDLPPVTGQRVALTGTSIEKNACANRLDAATGQEFCTDLRQTPVLDWTASPEASHYMVYLAHDREMTNPVYGSPYITTQNTRWTPVDLLPDSQAGDAYFWYVRPCKAFNVCAPDPTSTANSATHAFDKASLPVELTGPEDGARVANEVTLQWQDNLAHLGENPQSLNGEAVNTAATVEAGQYRVQISDNAGFNRPLVNELVDQTTYTPYSRTLPEGPLYWRVQAVDGSNNSLTWSEVRTIDKQSPAVTLRGPAESGQVDGTPYFHWAPQNFASAYRLEVYRNNDTTLSSAGLALSATTRQAAYAPTQPLQPSSKPYLWRVQRLDADGLAGPWSAPRAFRVTGQSPALVAPGSSAYIDAQESYFSWKAVPGAMRYQFERRPEDSPNMAETVTTHALSWAPTSAVSDGRWEWRVSSIDSQGQVLATAPWRTFAVDTTRPRVKSRQPGRTTTSGANWVLTFSEPVRRVNTTTMRLYKAGRADPVAARISSSNGGKTWTLNPSSAMSRRVRYTLKLSSGITDRAGNKLAATSYSSTPQ